MIYGLVSPPIKNLATPMPIVVRGFHPFYLHLKVKKVKQVRYEVKITEKGFVKNYHTLTNLRKWKITKSNMN